MNKLVSGLLGIAAISWTGAALACTPGQADYDSCFFEQLNQLQIS